MSEEKKSHTSVRQCFLLVNGIGSGKEVCHMTFFSFFEELGYVVWEVRCVTTLAENTEIFSNEQH